MGLFESPTTAMVFAFLRSSAMGSLCVEGTCNSESNCIEPRKRVPVSRQDREKCRREPLVRAVAAARIRFLLPHLHRRLAHRIRYVLIHREMFQVAQHEVLQKMQ